MTKFPCFCRRLGALALAVALPASAQLSADLLGRNAPNFAGQDQDGNRWKLSDHLGKQAVFLYFYPKDGSSGCTAEACSLRDNISDFKQAGVEIVGVSFDDKATHKIFAFKYDLDFVLLADTNGAIADAYDARMGEQVKTDAADFAPDEIKDLPAIVKRLVEHSDPVSELLWQSLSKEERLLLKNYDPAAAEAKPALELVAHTFQKAIGGSSIHTKKRFKGISLRPETVYLLKTKPSGHGLVRLNRLLLEDAFPQELARNQTMDRRVSFLIALDGKIIHITDSPDPAVHLKELTAALAGLKGN